MKATMFLQLSPELLFQFILLYIVIFLILFRHFNLLETILISVVKSVFFLLYFSGILDFWTHLDDVTYYIDGQKILNRLCHSGCLLTTDIFEYAFSLSGGRHILYSLYNATAQYILGPFYSSAVFFNIVLSVLSGVLIKYIFTLCGYSRQYSKLLAIFYMLHVDVFVWSGMINIKGTFVIFLTLLSFYIVFLFIKNGGYRYIVAFIVVTFLLSLLRFYIPALIIASVVFYFISTNFRFKYFVLLTTILVVVSLYLWPYVNLSIIEPATILTGIFRFLLTPQPWSIEPTYKYLFIPSITNLILFFPMVLGLMLILRDKGYIRILVIYFLICVALYSMIPELQGPRHRYQLIPFIALFQFNFLYYLLKRKV